EEAADKLRKLFVQRHLSSRPIFLISLKLCYGTFHPGFRSFVIERFYRQLWPRKLRVAPMSPSQHSCDHERRGRAWVLGAARSRRLYRLLHAKFESGIRD